MEFLTLMPKPTCPSSRQPKVPIFFIWLIVNTILKNYHEQVIRHGLLLSLQEQDLLELVTTPELLPFLNRDLWLAERSIIHSMCGVQYQPTLRILPKTPPMIPPQFII